MLGTALFFGLLIVYGCATQSESVSRDEHIEARTRTFEQPKEKIIEAAKEVIRLSDPNDVTFEPTPDGFLAFREFIIRVLIDNYYGEDRWTFTTEQTDGTVEASVFVSRQSAGLFGSPREKPIKGNAIYELFWHRVDYLLTGEGEWITCDDMKQQIQAGTQGDLRPMCGRKTVDQAP